MYGLATDAFGQVMCLPSQQALLLSLKEQCHQGFIEMLSYNSFLFSAPVQVIKSTGLITNGSPALSWPEKSSTTGIKQEFTSSDNPGIASNTDSLKYQCF